MRCLRDWSDEIRRAPFYNPNLTRDSEQFNGFSVFSIEEQIAHEEPAGKGTRHA
jgi:hypothetical protein